MQITIDLLKTNPQHRALIVKFLSDYLGEMGLAPAQDLIIKASALDEQAVAAAFGKAAPLPPAPQVAAVTVPVGTSGVDLDKNGFPWDARIHSSNHAKVADGTWRKRRGIDDATVAQVEAELRAVMGAPVAVTNVVHAPQVLAPVGVQTVPLPLADPLAIPDALRRSQPEAPTAPPAPVVVQAPAADPMAGFVALVSRTSAAIGNGKIKQDQVMAICQQHGVPSLPMLSNRLDLLPVIAESIDAFIQLAG